MEIPAKAPPSRVHKTLSARLLRHSALDLWREIPAAAMDVHRVSPGQMDYTDSKREKKLPCQEERLDSGLDSLKEDDLVEELEALTVTRTEERAHEYEPWRSALTEDGDT